jgi:hypothetical protein
MTIDEDFEDVKDTLEELPDAQEALVSLSRIEAELKREHAEHYACHAQRDALKAAYDNTTAALISACGERDALKAALERLIQATGDVRGNDRAWTPEDLANYYLMLRLRDEARQALDQLGGQSVTPSPKSDR